MYIYILSLIISLSIAKIGMMTRSYHDGNTVIIAVCAGLPLFLVSALRYGIGTDYLNYVRAFLNARRALYTLLLKKEILYFLLNKTIMDAGIDFQWFFVICAAITVLYVFLAIFYASPNPIMSIFLFVATTLYFWSFNVVRQSLSCAIIFFSLRYVERRELKKFLFCMLFAIGFHISSVVCICIYFLPKIKLTPRKAFALLAMLVMTSPFLTKVLLHFVALTPYARYIGSVFDKGEVSMIGMTIIFLIFCLASLYYKLDSRYQLYYNILFIALTLAIFSGRVVLIGRLIRFFMFPTIIMVPLALAECKNSMMRYIISYTLICCYSLYCYILIVARGVQDVYPYQCILQSIF